MGLRDEHGRQSALFLGASRRSGDDERRLHCQMTFIVDSKERSLSLRFALRSVAVGLILHASSLAQEATIHVHAHQPQVDVSRFMTGACIEDVNHEIYGGVYSQMI